MQSYLVLTAKQQYAFAPSTTANDGDNLYLQTLICDNLCLEIYL